MIKCSPGKAKVESYFAPCRLQEAQLMPMCLSSMKVGFSFDRRNLELRTRGSLAVHRAHGDNYDDRAPPQQQPGLRARGRRGLPKQACDPIAERTQLAG